MEKKESRKIGKYLVIALIVLGMLVYFFVPPVNATMNNVLRMFVSGDFTVIRQFVGSYGAYVALVSFLLMILQSITTPLPTFPFTFADTDLFGWWKGAILSWSSAMADMAVCFYITRLLRRDAVEELTSETNLKQIDESFEEHGRLSILIAGLLPFTSFGTVGYAAGLTSIFSSSFFIATDIRQLPATIIYSCVGGMLTGGAKMFITALLLLFALSTLVVSSRQLYIEKQEQENSDKSVDITNSI